jgi:hypothetical protein
MERSAYAEAGESACTGWVLARLMLPRSGCVHASRALRVLQIGLIEIRFIKFNLTSRAYQSKSSPLEGFARPGLYHDRHPMVRSKGPPVRGPLPCRRAQS